MKLLKSIGLFIAMMAMVPAVVLAQKPKGKDQLVTIETPQGEIKLVLFDDTPKHKENFLKLAREGFYDGTTFHRVIDGFMIQGGDPNTKDEDPYNDGQGSLGYTVPAEIKPTHKHVRGAVAAARQDDRINPERASSASQFYIVENHNGTPMLDNVYTVFGQVVDGLDVIDKIAEQPTGGRDRPLSDIEMKVTVEDVKKKKIAKKYDYNYNTQTLEKE
ncbi:peptidyl-prolyl cis-trans isomerase B (cyclophilin B) [Pontibacter ummariensis]|uniref:Peptidyl-prolyl cis-trans isomerase n=1 Tax=Pontibacter ummariensis TaxID=1610492 RepID=A0A239B4M7_9BACT|nr:peptidylprolyl isomerase [Pontibacter ummariensis]PRY16308.1 peptidyl-prolyl cis-trans isomerase B (cyclophilin B) [Pontibacter ummariensis]SNS02906.1 peptidyl-prolyl cis-trans isomerase B (cyclophilin B) [Pontibacter ummariensis]